MSDWHPLRYKKVEKAVKLWQNRSIHVKRMILLFETDEFFSSRKSSIREVAHFVIGTKIISLKTIIIIFWINSGFLLYNIYNYICIKLYVKLYTYVLNSYTFVFCRSHKKGFQKLMYQFSEIFFIRFKGQTNCYLNKLIKNKI